MDAGQFGARLKELRNKAGLTQKQLAENAGVAERTVSSLEQGLYEPVMSTMFALAEALGVDCRAFKVPPAEVRELKPGRPRKAAEPAPTEKRKRGRPRKGK